MQLESSKAKVKAAQKSKSEIKKEIKPGKTAGNKQDSTHKFDQYLDFRVPVKYAKPHQVHWYFVLSDVLVFSIIV